MIKTSVLTQEDFDALLKWFSPNREEAGGKYEKIREGLIRYFHSRGFAAGTDKNAEDTAI